MGLSSCLPPPDSEPGALNHENGRKPNLVFIWTDEQRFDTMAAYGNDYIKTPNLNALAEESFVFRNAYVTQPVCTPSRSTVMTGLWPHQNGCIHNNIPLRKGAKCLPELVGDPEYRCAYMGKWHLGDEVFAQHGFDVWEAIEDGYHKHYGKGRASSARSNYHHFLVEKGYEPDRGGRFSRGFAARRPIEHCKPKFLETRAREFLEGNKGRPFMLYVNFLEPHMPFFGPLDDLHDPEKILFPSNFDDPLEENEPLRYRLQREYCRKRYGKDEKSLRRLSARYQGLVAQVDRAVGGILEALDELGLSDNTIVVYTSDHGDMMGSHGLVMKTVMYEEAVKVPWLMRVPRLGRKQKLVDAPVSHIDLVPTLLELMGVASPVKLPGRSLVPVMAGGQPEEGHVFIQWHGEHMFVERGTKLATWEEIARLKDDKVRAVVSPDGWKLCLSDTDKCQLFNLKEDPEERTNLFYSGQHREVIERLTSAIREWQRSVGDEARV